MLAIVDYEAGNVTSVRRALESLGISCRITASEDDLRTAVGVVFPGVGAAGSAMASLGRRGLDRVLGQCVEDGKPILGICLGCQVVLDSSEENDVRTLGLVPGVCRRFPSGLCESNGEPVRIPHMGWNSVDLKRDCRLFENVGSDAEFYFVHSYYPAPEPDLVIGTTEYGIEFCSVLGRDGFWAVQFHPEKSGNPGLTILDNFHRYCKER